MIAKPEICLLNPFEQIKIEGEDQDGYLTLFKEEDYSDLPLYLWNGTKPFGSS